MIWNDGSGVRYAVSQDSGASWNLRPRINEQGGSSHLAIGPHGEIAVRITPWSASGKKFNAGVDLIAVSRDGGKTWQAHPAAGERDWSPDFDKGTPRWVEPLAWDADGALYSLWGSAKGLWLARSPDHGETWTSWHIVERDELSFFPYLIARGHGELAATWSSGKGDSLQAHVATIHVGDGKTPPQVTESQPFQMRFGDGIRNIEPPRASTYRSYFSAPAAWGLSLQFRIAARSVLDLSGGNSWNAETTSLEWPALA